MSLKSKAVSFGRLLKKREMMKFSTVTPIDDILMTNHPTVPIFYQILIQL